MLNKYFPIVLFTLLSCFNKNNTNTNYQSLYDEAFGKLNTYLSKCADSYNKTLGSISVSDSFYILSPLDTIPMGDKNYSYIPLMVRDSAGVMIVNRNSQKDNSFDSNHSMMTYNWDNILLDYKAYSKLKLDKEVNLTEKGTNNIRVSFSPPYQQEKVILVLAKIHSNDVFLADDFFVFIELKLNDINQYKVHRIFDTVNGCA